MTDKEKVARRILNHQAIEKLERLDFDVTPVLCDDKFVNDGGVLNCTSWSNYL